MNMKNVSAIDTSQNIVITPGTANLVITPYALAKMSEDLYLSSKNYSPERFPLVNYFLYCASVELGLKAAVLNVNCSQARKQEMKTIRHDLSMLISRFETIVRNDLMNEEDKKILRAINRFYKDKGLEYFTSAVMYESTQAYKNFPKIESLERVSTKIYTYIGSEDFFINADTVK